MWRSLGLVLASLLWAAASYGGETEYLPDPGSRRLPVCADAYDDFCSDPLESQHQTYWGAPYLCTAGALNEICDENADCAAGSCVPAGTSGTSPALQTTFWRRFYTDGVVGNIGDAPTSVWERHDSQAGFCYNRTADFNSFIDANQHAFCEQWEADYRDLTDTFDDSYVEWHTLFWKDPILHPGQGAGLRINEITANATLGGVSWAPYGGDADSDEAFDSDEYSLHCGSHLTAGMAACTIGGANPIPFAGGPVLWVNDANKSHATSNVTGGIVIEPFTGGTGNNYGIVLYQGAGSAAPNTLNWLDTNIGVGVFASREARKFWVDDVQDTLRLKTALGEATTKSDGYSMGPTLWGNSTACWVPSTGASAPTGIGMNAAVTGTVSHPALATTNLLSSIRKSRNTSAAGAGSTAAFAPNDTQVWRGNAAGLGGFHFWARFALSTVVATGRAFVGLSPSGFIGNVEPSTLLNAIYVGMDASGTTLNICSNDGAGSAVCTDLGANFPANSATAVYDVDLMADPHDGTNASDVRYSVRRLDSAQLAQGTITNASGNLPATTAFMIPQLWHNNGTTASAVALDMARACVSNPL